MVKQMSWDVHVACKPLLGQSVKLNDTLERTGSRLVIAINLTMEFSIVLLSSSQALRSPRQVTSRWPDSYPFSGTASDPLSKQDGLMAITEWVHLTMSASLLPQEAPMDIL